MSMPKRPSAPRCISSQSIIELDRVNDGMVMMMCQLISYGLIPGRWLIGEIDETAMIAGAM